MVQQNISGPFQLSPTLVLLPTRNSTFSAGGLRSGLQPFVTDLGFCVIRKGEIIERTWHVHVRWKQGIPETKLFVRISARAWNRVREQCCTGLCVGYSSRYRLREQCCTGLCVGYSSWNRVREQCCTGLCV